MAHPVTVMWTTPRSRSTAFERMMIERGDHTVLDEPFSARYYFSTERRSARYAPEEPDATGEAVLESILAEAQTAPVFVKDMAYHVSGLLGTQYRGSELLGHFTNTFLVREPRSALRSLARKWPDFTDEEAGYDALAGAFDRACSIGRGSTPVVLDADELAADPERIVAAWCDAVGIDAMPEALTWEPGMVPQWVRWQDWYAGVAASDGFNPPAPPAAMVPDDRAPQVHDGLLADRQELLERCSHTYERLAAVRVSR